MKRGFTIVELLVASMLLGMLVTILTMIFNQSSIAWRIGTASVADLDETRDRMAAIREEADNALYFPSAQNRMYRTVGLWDSNGELRKRACDDMEAIGGQNLATYEHVSIITKPSGAEIQPRDFQEIPVGSGDIRNADTYTVNVKSAGPNKRFDDYDDIWSWPDDFD